MENNNNNINAIIDYLYGELTQKEKEAFELKLKENPDLQKELDDLKAVRKAAGSLGDREVMDPYLFQAGFNNSILNKTINRPRFTVLRSVVVIAATFTLFFLVGYFTRASIQFNKDSVILSFGEKKGEDKTLTAGEVSSLIEQKVAVNNRQILEQLSDSQTAFKQVLEDHRKKEASEIRKLFASYTQVKNEEIDGFLARLQKDNRELVNEYVTQASALQQQNLQNTFTSFAEYLQKQRNLDLQKIQSSLVTLKESQDKQKIQTSQILTSIISSMNTQNN